MAFKPKNSRGKCNSTFWTKTRSSQLIKLFELNCDLWDASRKLYCDRSHKQKLLSEIAKKLQTNSSEVVSKLHNLRCQYNGELRKIKSKKNEFGSQDSYAPRWEFFDALRFLSNSGQQHKTLPNEDFLSTPSDDLSEHCGLDSSKDTIQPTVLPSGSKKRKRSTSENLQNESFKNNSIRLVGTTIDSHQIFGDYIADHLRNMPLEKQKQLKILIQIAILEVEEVPDSMNATVSTNLRHFSQVISQSDVSKASNTFSQNADIWREYFAFNMESNVNTCLIEYNRKPCGQKILGDQDSNLMKHIKQKHADFFDKMTQNRINQQQQEQLKNAMSDDDYAVVNEAELDTIDTDFNYDTEFDPLELEPTINYHGKEGFRKEHVGINDLQSLCANKNGTFIKREMSEEVELEPEGERLECRTPDEIDEIEAKIEEKREEDLIDSKEVTQFFFKGLEYVQMSKDHYLQDKRKLLSTLQHFKNIINNAKFRLEEKPRCHILCGLSYFTQRPVTTKAEEIIEKRAIDWNV